MRTCASVKTLCEFKDITPELANKIRHIWKHATRADVEEAIGDMLHHGFLENTAYGRMLWINRVAEYHGVEYLGRNRNGLDVDFLNAGDTYTETLVFVGDRLFITTVGDLVESGYIREEKNNF